jgi:hypothetical protein
VRCDDSSSPTYCAGELNATICFTIAVNKRATPNGALIGQFAINSFAVIKEGPIDMTDLLWYYLQPTDGTAAGWGVLMDWVSDDGTDVPYYSAQSSVCPALATLSTASPTAPPTPRPTPQTSPGVTVTPCTVSEWAQLTSCPACGNQGSEYVRSRTVISPGNDNVGCPPLRDVRSSLGFAVF